MVAKKKRKEWEVWVCVDDEYGPVSSTFARTRGWAKWLADRERWAGRISKVVVTLLPPSRQAGRKPK